MKQRLSPQTGTRILLKKGDRLKVVDPEGQQVADLFCFAADPPFEALSSGRSLDYNETIFLTTGHVLYSQTGRPLLRIQEDTCGRHDFLVTPCSLQMFQMISQTCDYHPSCLENLEKAFDESPVDLRLIGTTFNIFMNYEIAANGKMTLGTPRSRPGDFIVFEALADLIVGLTACSDEATNAGHCKPIDFEVQSVTRSESRVLSARA